MWKRPLWLLHLTCAPVGGSESGMTRGAVCVRGLQWDPVLPVCTCVLTGPWWKDPEALCSSTPSSYLVTSAMTLFSSKVTFWGTRGFYIYIWGRHIQPLTWDEHGMFCPHPSQLPGILLEEGPQLSNLLGFAFRCGKLPLQDLVAFQGSLPQMADQPGHIISQPLCPNLDSSEGHARSRLPCGVRRGPSLGPHPGPTSPFHRWRS